MKNSPEFEKFGQIIEEYNDAYSWLLSLVTDPSGNRYLIEKSPAQRHAEYEDQLKRTAAFLDFLGNPQDSYKSIHIAGTGGKGSVTTMIGSLLQETGLRVGVHTSPYLQVPNEKLLVNGKMAAPSKFTSLVNGFKQQYDEFTSKYPNLTPRHSEAWVAMVHLYFAQQQVDWGVIETGMGGRFDPTNVLSPELSVITNVDFDHVPQLGTTLEEIAFHKAGIIKPSKPVITGETKTAVLDIIQREASDKNSPLFRTGQDFNVEVKTMGETGSVVDIATPLHRYSDIKINLPGIFQPQNAATAVMAVDILSSRHQIPLTSEKIERALRSIKFAGRMEKVQAHPTVILDGAHNPQKMESLARSLQAVYGNRTYTLIVGMLATKDASSSITYLLPNVHRVVATSPHIFGKPSIKIEDMAGLIRTIDPAKNVETADNAVEAIRRVLNGAVPGELIVVTGSIYMLGEAREHWFPKKDILLEAEYGHS
jgi:dihydrofolate synthase/folylpolyglutamate synthase